MKLCILSRQPRCYSTARLRQAALDRGHRCKVLNTLRFSLTLEEANPDLVYAGKPVEHFDGVIPRIGASVTFFGTAIVRQFQQMGVFCANSAVGISQSRDKLRSLQVLSRHDIGIPATAFVRDRGDILKAIERVGGVPVIIKLIEGTQGVGVILAETTKVAEAIIEAMQSARQNVLIQKFVAESKGRDIRAIVVGDRVVAAMRRRAGSQTEFRSNVHRGGKTESIELDEVYTRTAVRSTQILGLRIAGVDMLEGNDGPQVMEVNSSPGLEGIERATDRDIAGEIVDYIAEHVAYPELDVRQRLTVTGGWGVAELVIPRGSTLSGQTLAETHLVDREIRVLAIDRPKRPKSDERPKKGDSERINLPDGSVKLKAGDRLTCFGRLSEMRDLLPTRKRRSVKRITKAQWEAFDDLSDPPGEHGGHDDDVPGEPAAAAEPGTGSDTSASA